jgi:cytochrome b561
MLSTAVEAPFVRLQVEPGLRGVTKLRWRDWPSRNWLSWLCGAVFLGLATLVVFATTQTADNEPGWHETVRWGFTIALVALVVLRILLEATVSKPRAGEVGQWDRQLGDPWWTTIHTLTGVVLGLWLTPFFVVVGLTIAWELLEMSVPGFGDEEINGNRLVDMLVAWVGWLAAAAIAAAASDVSVPFLP